MGKNQDKLKIRSLDYIRIEPDPKFKDLSEGEREEIMDSLLNPENETKRGLLVTFDLSHSGKKINNRIYPPRGQRLGLSSLVDPFPKPIVTNHNDMSDPIGRFVGGTWEDTSNEALGFFPNAKDFMKFKDTFEENNPKKIYEMLSKHNLLTNPKWPGMGRMRVQARIIDEEAIRKFLDGRYLTFSAGSHSNKLICSICNQDLMEAEDICHWKGHIYDGKLCVYITDMFYVDEGSVVNHPADDLSQVVSMKFADSVDTKDFPEHWDAVDESTVYMTDSVYTVVEKRMSKTDPKPEELTVEKLFGQIIALFPDGEGKSTLTEPLNSIISQYMGKGKVEPPAVTKEPPEDEEEDAVLTAEGRKRLSESTFCGPDRSYPVPDKCLTAETGISLLDGRTMPIGEMPGAIEAGEELWVYGFDLAQKAIVPARIEKAWKSIEEAKIVKVTLDNGAVVRCTENHPFLTREMEYVRADSLKRGDSLMPLYLKRVAQHESGTSYLELKQPWYNYWESVHVMVARNVLGRPKKDNEVIHHKDENREKNTPDNLQYMTRREHLLHHNTGRRTVPNKSKVIEREIRSKFMRNLMAQISADPVRKSLYSEAVSSGKRLCNWADPSAPIGNSGVTLNDIIYSLRSGVRKGFLAKKLGVNSSSITRWVKKSGIPLGEIEFSESRVGKEVAREYFMSEFGVSIDVVYADFCSGIPYVKLQEKYRIDRSTLRQWFTRLGYETDKVKAVLSKEGLSLEDVYNKWTEGEGSLSGFERDYGFGAGTFQRAFERNASQLESYNHKVVSIEYDGTADVYDLEVPTTSNFALASGVFVHNSHAANALARAKQNASPALYSRIKACVCRKAKANGWNLPACGGGDSTNPPDWTPELEAEALAKEAMIMVGLDWNLAEMAMAATLGDKVLTEQARDSLEEKDFLGPDRTFPLADCDHIDAFEKMIDKLAISDIEKYVLETVVDRKSKEKECPCKEEIMRQELDALKGEHSQLLGAKHKLETDLSNVLELLAKSLKKDFSEDKKLEDMLQWFSELDKEAVGKQPVVESKVDDPSLATGGKIGDMSKLGEYERGIVTEYKKLRDSKGKDAAEQFLAQRLRYLPAGFRPESSIGE